jgi:hypothetical protein
LVLCGLESGVEDARRQWTLRDIAGLVLDHFDLVGEANIRASEARSGTEIEAGVVR